MAINQAKYESRPVTIKEKKPWPKPTAKFFLERAHELRSNITGIRFKSELSLKSYMDMVALNENLCMMTLGVPVIKWDKNRHKLYQLSDFSGFCNK